MDEQQAQRDAKQRARIALQLDPEAMNELAKLAVIRDRSVSYLVREAVAAWFANQGIFVPVSPSDAKRSPVLHKAKAEVTA